MRAAELSSDRGEAFFVQREKSTVHELCDLLGNVE